jgi:hypothetical protein
MRKRRFSAGQITMALRPGVREDLTTYTRKSLPLSHWASAVFSVRSAR